MPMSAHNPDCCGMYRISAFLFLFAVVFPTPFSSLILLPFQPLACSTMVEDFHAHGAVNTGVVHQLPTVVPGPSFGNVIEQVSHPFRSLSPFRLIRDQCQAADSLGAERIHVYHTASHYVLMSTQVYFATQHAHVYIFADATGACCVNGMSMLVKKSAIHGICGGLEPYARYLAEDFFLTQALHDAGKRHRLCRLPARQRPGPVSLRDVVMRQLRSARGSMAENEHCRFPP